jgi:hypothetical protein
MLATMHNLIVFAAEANEELVPPDDWRSIIALPAAFLFFFVSIYLLLRSNLGTRRAYLVMATSFFGFMVILSLYWTTGAPGTPMATGPQNLPGQVPDYYQPKWEPFAADSVIGDERFPLVKSFPEGFSAVPDDDPELADLAATAVDELQGFFSETRAGVAGPIGQDWVAAGEPQVAVAADNAQVVGVTFAPPFPDDSEEGTPGEPDTSGDTYTAFAFYDPGFILFPSLVMVALSLAGFVLHLLLLARDENREKEEQAGDVAVEPERVPAGA